MIIRLLLFASGWFYCVEGEWFDGQNSSIRIGDGGCGSGGWLKRNWKDEES